MTTNDNPSKELTERLAVELWRRFHPKDGRMQDQPLTTRNSWNLAAEEHLASPSGQATVRAYESIILSERTDAAAEMVERCCTALCKYCRRGLPVEPCTGQPEAGMGWWWHPDVPNEEGPRCRADKIRRRTLSLNPNWRKEIEREAREPYRKLLKWALDEIANQDYVEDDDTPPHACGYTGKPSEGYCQFHENYHAARALLADEDGEKC